MIAMKFTIELDIGLSFLLQAALPQLVTDRETKTHRRGRSKRSYGHCRRRTEIPEVERLPNTARKHRLRLVPSLEPNPVRPVRKSARSGSPKRYSWRRGFSARGIGSLPTDCLERVQGLDGPLVGVQCLHKAMAQGGQGVGS